MPTPIRNCLLVPGRSRQRRDALSNPGNDAFAISQIHGLPIAGVAIRPGFVLPDCSGWSAADGQQARCHLLEIDSSSRAHGTALINKRWKRKRRIPKVWLSQAQKSRLSLGQRRNRSDLLAVTHLKVHFPMYKGCSKRVAGVVKAVDGVSLTLQRQDVGACRKSQGGKTTVGKAICNSFP
jgi:hypothetical protein